MGENYIVSSIDRAALVLRLISRAPKGLSLAELARQTEVPKTTLFRILTTLQHHHFVQWSEVDRRFQLGHYLWELGSGYLDRCEPKRIAEPHMKKLSETTGETVFLARIERDVVVFLHRVDGKTPLALMPNLSRSAPVYCTASGRAILAFLPEEERDRVLRNQRIVQHTERTVTDWDALLQTLHEVRQQGYSVVDSEYNKNLVYLSAPIFDHAGYPQASLTIGMLSSMRLESDPFGAYKSLIKDVAAVCSREMGYIEKAAPASGPKPGGLEKP